MILLIIGEQTIPIYKCRLDSLLISKDMQPSLKDVKIYNDHSALGLFLSPEEKKDQQGPGFGNSIIHC